MRIVVMSDSHGRIDRVRQVIAQQPDAELFIFLGDGTRDFHAAMRGIPKEDWCVCGNSDFGSDDEYILISYVKDVKFYCTHGHQWGVKYDMTELLDEAKKKEINVLLFGHTHQAYYEYRDGIHIRIRAVWAVRVVRSIRPTALSISTARVLYAPICGWMTRQNRSQWSKNQRRSE